MDHDNFCRTWWNSSAAGCSIEHDCCILLREGAGRGNLYGGPWRYGSDHWYRYHDGVMRNGLTVATWNLTDVDPGDGGFVSVPGSHKSNFLQHMPRDVARLAEDVRWRHAHLHRAHSRHRQVNRRLQSTPFHLGQNRATISLTIPMLRRGRDASWRDRRCKNTPKGDGQVKGSVNETAKEAVRAVEMAVDHGITLLDTAKVYGPFTPGELLARGLGARRKDVVVVTKVGFAYRDDDNARGRETGYLFGQ